MSYSIPGIERTVEGRHVLLLNFPRVAEDVRTFDDVARLKRRAPGLVVAPHPFFPAATCLGRDLDRYPMLFDAIERNAMFTASVDFNQRAERWAVRHGKPIVGNCDVHRLQQLGSTYSLVDAEPSIRRHLCSDRRRPRASGEPAADVGRGRPHNRRAMFFSDAAPRPEPQLAYARGPLIRVRLS